MNYYYIIEGLVRNNIGDVLQGMAAAKYLPATAKPVDREQLSLLDSKERSFLLASGWFMHDFSKFPPPDAVQVCYISLHIANSALLQNQKIRDHFKKNAPIGCRDKKTLYLFLGWGIPAYYSGCLTITTNPRKPVLQKEGPCLLVDNIDHPVPEPVLKKLELLTKKEFTRVTHDPADVLLPFEDYVNQGVNHMENLLQKYCEASVIVTTKIHCALPCLGMGAPVILIHPNPQDPRLDTVRQFIDILSYDQLLKSDRLIMPEVRIKKLQAQKGSLSAIVEASVAHQKNILQKPDRAFFYKIKLQSVVSSMIFRMTIVFLLKLGLANRSLKRVFVGSN
ncbi:MAG: polysaccharide pyruvyl transferase family protein [Lacibacter sp.]